MHKTLQAIIAKTKEDIADASKRSHPGNPPAGGASRIDSGQARMTTSSFYNALKHPKRGQTAIIAEVKFASPSDGVLGSQQSFLARIRQYEKAGVDALSIITEKHFFKGDPLFVTKAKKVTKLPVLQKDFVVDAYQIYEAKQAGADAILLIARIVTKNELVAFVDIAHRLGVEPIVEIHNEEDVEKALATKTRIIAVNARDLDTFTIDVDRACRLLKKIDRQFIKLGFSGIHSKQEVGQYRKAGADGVLIGTSLMKAKNIQAFLRGINIAVAHENFLVHDANPHGKAAKKTSFSANAHSENFVGSLPTTVKVKICGIRTMEAAQAALDSGADFLGFNFVPTSKRYINPLKAKKIINKVKGKVKVVGVFQNESSQTVNKIARDIQLDYVQLHGEESVYYCKKVATPVIKAFNLPANFSIVRTAGTMLRYSVPLYLTDRGKQGEGVMINPAKAAKLAKRFPLIFSGGLTVENVSEVVRMVKPYGVDVASGVETEGEQDLEKIRAFIRNAKGRS